jgi:hypothetical protein
MQVLLIGNMGLYDYRPYVKKISNDRQIMYDCEKEYRLDPGNCYTVKKLSDFPVPSQEVTN